MRKRRVVTLLTLTLMLMTAFAGNVRAADPPVTLSPAVKAAYSSLAENARVKQGLEFLEADQDQALAEQLEIVQIEAPPFKETKRGQDLMQRLQALGLKEVQMDSAGNVYGIRPGTGNGPQLVVAAHLDTVFPEGTNVTPVEKDGKIYAPGIADDTRGLAALLSIVRAFNETKIQTVGDIIFLADVGEEGLGDLRGMKTYFRDHPETDGFISIESGGPERITYLATGSHRYEVSFKGPGGHSFGAFGLPSAIHAMGRAIAHFGDLQTPKTPKTTFTVGTVSGGTSVNSIAGDATMFIDMRSNDENELLKLEARFKEVVQQGVAEENARWKVTDEQNKITVSFKLVGDRPAGTQPKDAPIVQAAWAGIEAAGFEPRLSGPSSTDSNLPISIGVPAITVGGGGESGGNHAYDEWYDPTDAYKGPQAIFLMTLGLVGVEGVSEPALTAAGPSHDLMVQVNGKPLKSPVGLQELDGRILLPLRAVGEALGGAVTWEDGTFSLKLGVHQLAVQPVALVQNDALVPVEEFIALGVKASIDPVTQILHLSY